MINVAIIGAAGYTGGELIRLLLRHPSVGERHIAAVSTSHVGQPVANAHPDLVGETSLTFTAHRNDFNATRNDFTAGHSEPDVIFLCLGHSKSRVWIDEHKGSIASSTRVIDLSVDFRTDTTWTYGLPEFQRDTIRTSQRIANPGCFATCIELALLPLRDSLDADVFVTALTGSTGAGQAPSDTTHFSWRANNIEVYKAFDHQHLPEIHSVLGTGTNATSGTTPATPDIVLVPMRGSWTRGILASCIVRTALSQDEALSLYRKRYEDHPFTHVVDDLPDVKRVVGTNKCVIGMQKSGNHLLVVSVIDNLLKGASGQAVQNMNIMCGFEETDGLLLKPAAY